MVLKTFDQLLATINKKQKYKLVVACAYDENVLKAVNICFTEGCITPVLVGEKKRIVDLLYKNALLIDSDCIVDVSDTNEIAKKAVAIVRNSEKSILMKGNISTRELLNAVVLKDTGLKTNAVLSHVAVFESPYYHKLFLVTDAAMNIAPDFEQKISILKNAVQVAHKMGIKIPKVAVVSAIETVNPKIESTVHAAMLKEMGIHNQIEACIIDGPFALDNAISNESAKHKNIISGVAGDADILLVPDLNSGNILYKSLVFLGGATVAGIIVGAKAPIVLTSRADSIHSKLISIKLSLSLL